MINFNGVPTEILNSKAIKFEAPTFKEALNIAEKHGFNSNPIASLCSTSKSVVYFATEELAMYVLEKAKERKAQDQALEALKSRTSLTLPERTAAWARKMLNKKQQYAI